MKISNKDKARILRILKKAYPTSTGKYNKRIMQFATACGIHLIKCGIKPYNSDSNIEEAFRAGINLMMIGGYTIVNLCE